MSKVSAAAFLQSLQDSQLLEPAQLDQLRQPPLTDDLQALAKFLVQQGWLTHFQVNYLVQGRRQDLRLGPYVLLERLGAGGMGQVFKAHHGPMDRIVALKIIRPELLANPDSVHRFYREVRAAAQLVHPNIVLAFDAGQAGDTHFFAMEYVPGSDLSNVVKAQGPLPVSEACDYIRQAALGLQHAHTRGLVHRDIKPSNLLLVRTQEAPTLGVVKILDLGLARLLTGNKQEKTLTQEGTVLGTPDYVAPEQALNAHTADIRSDLYSLGCTFYYLLTARTPFKGESATETMLKHHLESPVPVATLRPDVPVPVLAILDRLMAKRPEARFETPAQLAEVLAPFSQGVATERIFPAAVVQLPGGEKSGGSTRATMSGRDSPLAVTVPPAPDRATAPAVDKEALISTIALGTRSRVFPTRQRWVLAALILLLATMGIALGIWLASTGNETSTVAASIPSRSSERMPSQLEPRPEIRSFQGHAGPVRSVVFSANGKQILSGGKDGSARLWDVASGKEERRFTSKAGEISAVGLTSNGRLALAACADRTVRVWELASGKEILRLKDNGGALTCLATSPDEQVAVVGDEGSWLKVWDCQGTQAGLGLSGPYGAVYCLAFGPERNFVYSAADGVVRVSNLNAIQKRERSLEGHKGKVLSVAFSADGKRVVSGGLDRSIRLWDVESATAVRRLDGHTTPVTCLSLSPDSQRLVSGGGMEKGGDPVLIDGKPELVDCGLRLWDMTTATQLGVIGNHAAKITSVAFAPDGRSIVSASEDGTVRLWSVPGR